MLDKEIVAGQHHCRGPPDQGVVGERLGHRLEQHLAAPHHVASPAQDPRGYRNLGWDDVDALASAEQVRVSHGTNKVELGFAVLEHSDLTI